ncbi:MAG: hypothetical protein AMXMBFR55_09630 [Gemmatimonadota bacterium]
MTSALVIRLAIAALVGLAVGIEREWSGHGATGPEPRFAGVRTFLLMGGTGGIAGWLLTMDYTAIAVALVAGTSLLAAAAYWAAAREGGAALDGTTEVAAILVLGLGVLAGIGETAVAGGAGALAVLALSEKDAIRAAIARLDETEMRAALQFAVLSLVVLPVLPDKAYGPLGGINPRTLWGVVLIFSGLSFVGFIARKLVGDSRGYGVTGALGGLVSSTAVALQFSRLSRERAALSTPLAVGTVAATTVLVPRILILSYLLNHEVAVALLPYLGPAFLAGATMVTVLLVRSEASRHDGADEFVERNPLGLTTSIKMALAFQATLMLIEFVRAQFGSNGVLVSAALLGLSDTDALTLSMNRLGRSTGAVALAAEAIAVGVSANALVKMVIALALGGPAYRVRAATGLGILLALGIGAIVLLNR